MLSIKNLDAFYGKLHVLWDISLDIGNESVGIFGPHVSDLWIGSCQRCRVPHSCDFQGCGF